MRVPVPTPNPQAVSLLATELIYPIVWRVLPYVRRHSHESLPTSDSVVMVMVRKNIPPRRCRPLLTWLLNSFIGRI